MSLTEIENLAHAELKAQRDELVKAAAKAPANELAARYVQARTDAKARDEKLAEQGRTINALNDACETAKEKLAQAREANSELMAGLVEQSEAREKAEAEAASLLRRLARAVSLASFSALKDAMAARELDAAEKGE